MVVVSLSNFSTAQINYINYSSDSTYQNTQSVLILKKYPTGFQKLEIEKYKHRAFFCKLEHDLDNKLPINLRMRVGSLSYTKKMENY